MLANHPTVLGRAPTASSLQIGNVDGPNPAASTDKAVVRWDGTSGRLIQNSTTTLSDAGQLTLPVAGSLAFSTDTFWQRISAGQIGQSLASGSARAVSLSSDTASANGFTASNTGASGRDYLFASFGNTHAIAALQGRGAIFDLTTGVALAAFSAPTGWVFSTGAGGTTTLTLDTSQNAAFAGSVRAGNFTTVGAPPYAKGVIYFDTTLNKLRVGGASAFETITSV